MGMELSPPVEKIIGDIEQLPTLPAVYRNLQRMLSDPKVSGRDVGAVIEQDQALASKILKVVNSSYYGFPKEISTISHSVVILGFNEIKHMALSISLLKMFGGSGKSPAFDHREFWKHSLASAVCAGVIVRKAGQDKCSSHEEAFVAGLLHDIGKIFEDQYLHDQFAEAVRLAGGEKLLLVEAEKRVFGLTHQEIGGYLARKWRLPDLLETAIGFHHDPLRMRKDSLLFAMTAIIHCADVIVRGIGIGSGGDPYVPPWCGECWKELGLSRKEVNTVVDETVKIYYEVEKLLLEE